MKNFALIFLLLGVLMLTGFPPRASAQFPARVSDSQVQQLLNQLDARVDIYRNSLRRGLNRSRFNGTAPESEINGYVQEFDRATSQLRNRFGNRQTVAAEVEEVLSRGWHIDNFMRNNRLGAEAERDWATVRTDLQTLARYYNVTWRWNDRAYNPAGNRYDNQPRDRYDNQSRGGYGFGNHLTGTYTLDVARSDNVQRAAERATAGLDAQETERVRAPLLRRLNGRDYDFAGIIDAVRTSNGEEVRVNNEGVVREEDSQTERTVVRSGIGAALGAIIGGIAGGGKGAAIGAAVGAGAGAGTVLVQGRDDLDLVRGTEFTIRSSAPRQLTGR